MTTRDERRVAVLGLLDLHAQVRWHEPGGANAFADAVLELAGRLGRVDEVPALRPPRVATDQERRAAMTAIRADLAAVKLKETGRTAQ